VQECHKIRQGPGNRGFELQVGVLDQQRQNDLLRSGEFLRMKEDRELQRWKPISNLFEKLKTLKELSGEGRIPLFLMVPGITGHSIEQIGDYH
jgi:hypothetical protein